MGHARAGSNPAFGTMDTGEETGADFKSAPVSYLAAWQIQNSGSGRTRPSPGFKDRSSSNLCQVPIRCRGRRSPFSFRRHRNVRCVVSCPFKFNIPDREYSVPFQLKNLKIFPYGNYYLDGSLYPVHYSRAGIMHGVFFMKTVVSSTADIGAAIRKKRKADGLTLADAAGLCNVNYRFLSNLENGKTTVQLGKVLQVLHCLGIEIHLTDRIRTNA